MANAAPMSKNATLAVAGALGLAGVGIILYAVSRPAPGAPIGAPLHPGETLGNLLAPNLEAIPGGVIRIPLSGAALSTIAAIQPRVNYSGPGRDTYTYLAVRQMQHNQLVTVYASGLAPVHVGPAATPTPFPVVSPTQTEPSGCPAQSLCALPWPGTSVNPICGAPAQSGPADIYLEVYQNQSDSGDPRDADGFSSPSCNNRRYVLQKRYPGAVMFF